MTSNSDLGGRDGTLTAGDDSDLFVPKVSYKLVPIEQREMFMMQFKSRMGADPELHRVSNSDMIYLDHYLYQLRDFVYS